jgi:pimeloyl-ACP methyl ester carboxylesterase
LIAKVKELNLHLPDIPAEAIQYIKAPTMVIIGDFDIIPKHAVEMFRLLNGFVNIKAAVMIRLQFCVLDYFSFF